MRKGCVLVVIITGLLAVVGLPLLTAWLRPGAQVPPAPTPLEALAARYEKALTYGDSAGLVIPDMALGDDPPADLLVAAIGSGNGDLCRGAAMTAGLRGDPRLVEALLAVAGHGDGEARAADANMQALVRSGKHVPDYQESMALMRAEAAARAAGACIAALGQIGDRRSVGPLIELLQRLTAAPPKTPPGPAGAPAAAGAPAPPPQVLAGPWVSGLQYAVIRALGELQDPAAVPVLIDCMPCVLGARDEPSACELALVSIGRPAVPALLAELARPGATGLGSIHYVLGEIGDRRAVGPLVDDVSDDQGGATLALAKIGGDESLRAVLRNMTGQDPRHPGSGGPSQAVLEAQLPEAADLLLSDQSFVRLLSPQALADTGDPRAIELLIYWPNWCADPAAVARCGQAAFEPLLAALGSKHYGLASQAIWALGEIGDARAIEPLRKRLGLTQDWQDLRALEALGKLGYAQALPIARTWLEGWQSDFDRASVAARVLGGLGDVESAPMLIRMATEPLPPPAKAPPPWLRNRHAQERLAPVDALGQLQAPIAVEPLLKMLDDLARVSSPEYGWDLFDMPSGESPNLPYAVCRALSRIGDPRAVAPLRAALTCKNRLLRISAARALADMGRKEAFDDIAVLLRGDPDRDRAGKGLGYDTAVVDHLLKLDERRGLEELVKWLNAPSPRFGYEGVTVVRALGEHRYAPARPILEQGLKYVMFVHWRDMDDQRDPLFVYQIVKRYPQSLIYTGRPTYELPLAYGRVAGAAGVPLLLLALRSDTWLMRMGAAEALGEIGDPRAVEPLITALHHRVWCVREAAATALGAIKDPRAAAALKDALDDGNPRVRRAARKAVETRAGP